MLPRCEIHLTSPHDHPSRPAPQSLSLTGYVFLHISSADQVTSKTFLSLSLEAYIASRDHLSTDVDGVRLLRISQTLWQAACEMTSQDDDSESGRLNFTDVSGEQRLAFTLPLPYSNAQPMPSSFQSSQFKLHYKLVATLHAATAPVSVQRPVFIQGGESIDTDRLQIPFTRFVPVLPTKKCQTIGDRVCRSLQQWITPYISNEQVNPANSHLDSLTGRPRSNSTEAIVPVKSQTREPSMVSVTLPATGFCPGDEIPFIINCTEKEATRLQSVQVELRRKIVMATSKPSASSFTSTASSFTTKLTDRSTIHTRELMIPSHPESASSRNGRVELRCVYRLPTKTPLTNDALPEFKVTFRLRIVMQFAELNRHGVIDKRRFKTSGLFSRQVDPGMDVAEVKSKNYVLAKMEIPITVGRRPADDDCTSCPTSRLKQHSGVMIHHPTRQASDVSSKYEDVASLQHRVARLSVTSGETVPSFSLNDQQTSFERLLHEQSLPLAVF